MRKKHFSIFILIILAFLTGCAIKATVPDSVKEVKFPVRAAVVMPDKLEWEADYKGEKWKGRITSSGAESYNVSSYPYPGMGGWVFNMSRQLFAEAFPSLFDQTALLDSPQGAEGYPLTLLLSGFEASQNTMSKNKDGYVLDWSDLYYKYDCLLVGKEKPISFIRVKKQADWSYLNSDFKIAEMISGAYADLVERAKGDVQTYANELNLEAAGDKETVLYFRARGYDEEKNLREYLEKYPGGKYSENAIKRLAEFDKERKKIPSHTKDRAVIIFYKDKVWADKGWEFKVRSAWLTEDNMTVNFLVKNNDNKFRHLRLREPEKNSFLREWDGSEEYKYISGSSLSGEWVEFPNDFPIAFRITFQGPNNKRPAVVDLFSWIESREDSAKITPEFSLEMF